MENGTTVPVKGLGNIKLKDLWKGLYYAIAGQIVALFLFFCNSLLQEHPHFPTWLEWLPYIKATFAAIIGYLGAKFGVNNVGQILQKDKPVVHVDVESLNDLKAKAAGTLPNE